MVMVRLDIDHLWMQASQGIQPDSKHCQHGKSAQRELERATAGMAHSHGDADTHKQGNAWAVRSITTVPLTSLAAECMGHTVSEHHNTCHSWLDQADIAAVATALVG